MSKSFRWSWAPSLLMSVPPILLVVLGLWLHGTRPAELVASETRFKLLPKPLAHPAAVVRNPRSPQVAMQMVVFLKRPPGEKPVWWGKPVAPGFSDTPCFVSSKGQRRFISIYALNKATFDKKAQHYRAVVEFILPDDPAFTREGTLNASIDLWQKGRIVGSGDISTPVVPA